MSFVFTNLTPDATPTGTGLIAGSIQSFLFRFKTDTNDDVKLYVNTGNNIALTEESIVGLYKEQADGTNLISSVASVNTATTTKSTNTITFNASNLTNSGTTPDITFTGLEANTNYYFITKSTRNNSGADISACFQQNNNTLNIKYINGIVGSFAISSSLPSAPTITSVTASNRNVIVEMPTLTTGEGFYIVTSSNGTIISGGSSIKFTNLAYAIPYTFSVIKSNAIGYLSTPSASSAAVTLYQPEWAQIGSDIVGEAFADQSGYSVSLSANGKRVAIGTPFNDSNGSNSGHVRVYDYRGTTWTQVGGDIDGETAGDQSGFSVSLSADGTRVAIGAPQNDGNGSNSGHVRIYDYKLVDSVWNWTQIGQDIDGKIANDKSGSSVSLSADGKYVVIGAYESDGSKGTVSVYKHDTTTTPQSWIQVGTDIFGEAALDKSGYSVSLSANGSCMAIGARGNDGTTDNPVDNRGRVRVYNYDTTISDWIQVGEDIDGQGGDESGTSLSLSANGMRIAIGAPYKNEYKGSVRVYDLKNGSWIQVGEDIDGEIVNELNGFYVSLSANGMRIAIVASQFSREGRVRIYDFIDESWMKVESTIYGESLGEFFAASVSLSADGKYLAIGATFNDVDIVNNGGDNRGCVRVYEIASFPHNTPTNVIAVPGDEKATIYFDINGSDITKFTVDTYFNNDFSTPVATVDIYSPFTQENSASPIIITGLQNGKSYTFKITATMDSGFTTITSAAVVPISASLSNFLTSDISTLASVLTFYEEFVNSADLPSIPTDITPEEKIIASKQIINSIFEARTDINTFKINSSYLDIAADNVKENLVIVRSQTNEDIPFPLDDDLLNDSTSLYTALQNVGEMNKFKLGDNTFTIVKTTFGYDFTRSNNVISSHNDGDKVEYEGLIIVFGSLYVSVVPVQLELLQQEEIQEGTQVNILGWAENLLRGKNISCLSLSDDGKRMAFVVGYSSGGNSNGQVRTYKYNDVSLSWESMGENISTDGSGDGNDLFISLSADGNRLVIGTPFNNCNRIVNGNNVTTVYGGRVRIYGYNDSDSSWIQIGEAIDGEVAGDISGSSVSLSSDGKRVAIGAVGNNGGRGIVRLYESNANNVWSKVGEITGEAAGDNSGRSVSLSADGKRVAIGAPNNQNNVIGTVGHIRVYDESNGSWTQVGGDIDPKIADEMFGSSVSLSGDGKRMIINVLNNGDYVYLYELNKTSWEKIGQKNNGYEFGTRYYSLNANGSRAIMRSESLGRFRIHECINTSIATLNSIGILSDTAKFIDTLSNLGVTDGDNIDLKNQLDIVIPDSFTPDKKKKATQKLINSIFDLSPTLSTFTLTSSAITIAATNVKENLIIVKSTTVGTTFSLDNKLSDTTSLYCPLENVGEKNSFILENVPFSIVKTSTGYDFIDSENVTTKTVNRDQVEYRGIKIVFGSVSMSKVNVPSQARMVTATAGYCSATVKFTIPEDNGGSTISSYTVTAYPGGVSTTYIVPPPTAPVQNGNILVITLPSSSVGPITVRGLNTGTNYTFTVIATNSTGSSISSYPSNIVTPFAIVQLGSDILGQAADDLSGTTFSLSADGTCVAIGTPYNDSNGSNRGRVRIYKYNGTSWIKIGGDIGGEAVGDLSGWSVSLSSDGAYVAIGAPFNNCNPVVNGMNVYGGHVRIYRFNDGSFLNLGGDTYIYDSTDSWTQVGGDINGEAEFDASGTSVSLSADGTCVAIGAPYNDGNGANSGHVRIYKYNGTSWNKIGQDIDGKATGEWSGHCVSLSADGSRVAIGAPNNSSSTGQVRVYDLISGVWTQVGLDIVGKAAGDNNGWSVSLSADGIHLAIGAPYTDSNGNNIGNVRIYDFIGGLWKQIGQDIFGEAADDKSGYSVSLSADGKRVAIGAPFNDSNGSDSGHVRIYILISGVWTKIAQDIDGKAAGEQSGTFVSLSADGKRVAVGAPFNDRNANNAGCVRVYEILSSVPNPPTNVNAFVGNSEATVSFIPPIDNGRAAITSYTVTSGNRSATGSASPITLRGLTNGTEYTFNVVATNNIGSSLPAQSNKVKPFAPVVSVEKLGVDIVGSDINFGYSVSLSSDGMWMAIGQQSGGTNGIVRLYQFNSGTWFKIGEDILGKVGEAHSSECVSVSITGGNPRVAIGTPRNITGTGTVRIYEFTKIWVGLAQVWKWTQVGLDINGQADGDLSGYSASLSADGTRVAIGARGNDYGGTLSGHVRVYDLKNGAWTKVGGDISGGAVGDYSGYSVSLSADGTHVAIGAPFNNNATGRVCIYKIVGTNWIKVGVDIVGEAAGDWSGYSVSLSSDGKRVAIGARFNDGNGDNSGHVRIYEYDNDGSSWIKIGQDIDGEAAGDKFGSSVSLSADGKRIAIGTQYNNGNNGHVRVYKYIDSYWVQLGSDFDGEAGSLSGRSVSLNANGSRLAIGAKNSSCAYEIVTLPDAPTNVTAFADNTQATVSFTPPTDNGGSSITGYTVTASPGGATATGSASPLTVTGLTNGTEYTFSVVATNKVGSSVPVQSNKIKPFNLTLSVQRLGVDIFGIAGGEQSGYSVSLSKDGTRMAVGAPLYGTEKGGVKIYEFKNGSWEKIGQDIDGVAFRDYYGASISLSPNGMRVAIGASSNDRGQVRVYNYQLVNSVWKWVQVGGDIFGEVYKDNSGTSVSLNEDGTRVAIGAKGSSILSTNKNGCVRIYELSGSWKKIGGNILGEADDDESGTSVSLSADGTRVAIGAIQNDGNGNNSGQVRIYEYKNSVWNKIGDDIDGKLANDKSGFSVSLSADGIRVAIGAPFNNGRGHVRVYDSKPDGSNWKWTQVGLDINGQSNTIKSGYSVSLSRDGKRLAIGAPLHNGTGSVCIYKYMNSSWVQLSTAFYGEGNADNFGQSVSLSGDGSRLAIGAPNGSNTNCGSTRVYEIVTVPDAPTNIIAFVGNKKATVSFTPPTDNGGSVITGYTVTASITDSNNLSIGGNSITVTIPPNTDRTLPMDAIINGLTNNTSYTFTVVAINKAGSSVRSNPSNIVKPFSPKTKITNLGDNIYGINPNDRNGVSVSISADGKRMAIGARGYSSRGYVRIYEWGNVDSVWKWVQIGDVIFARTANNDCGLFISLSEDGYRIAIGERNGETPLVMVYDWKFVNSVWKWVQIGDDIRTNANSYFALGLSVSSSVSLSPDGMYIAIGASMGTGRSYTCVFKFNGSFYEILGQFTGETDGDLSGVSVSLSRNGKRVAIGAIFNNGNGYHSGHVRVYDYISGRNWTQVGKDIDGEAAGDVSGRTVSLSSDGSRLAIAAPYNTANGGLSGHVRIYDYNGTSWTQVGKDIDGKANSQSGYSVSLSADGRCVAIGAPLDYHTTGCVRIYKYIQSSWLQLGRDIEGEFFAMSGSCVSLNADGSRVAIGTVSNEPTSNYANVYEILTVPDAPTITKVEVNSNGQAFVYVTPTNTGGSEIIKYTVTSPTSGFNPVIGTSSPITVSRLLIGQSYMFKVSAENEIGVGDESLYSSPVVIPSPILSNFLTSNIANFINVLPAVTNGSFVNTQSLPTIPINISEDERKVANKKIINSIFDKNTTLTTFSLKSSSLAIAAPNVKTNLIVVKSTTTTGTTTAFSLDGKLNDTTSLYCPLEKVGEMNKFTLKGVTFTVVKTISGYNVIDSNNVTTSYKDGNQLKYNGLIIIFGGFSASADDPEPTPIEINMNVLVSAKGDIEMFGQAAPTVVNIIVADVKLPVSTLYSTENSFIEFWEPSDARNTFKAILSGSDPLNLTSGSDWSLLSNKLENGIQRCLEGKFDVSQASPFKTNYTDPLYMEVENFGELAIHTYAHYALGHINSSVAITNEEAFVKNMLSQNKLNINTQKQEYEWANESVSNKYTDTVTGTNADAKLAKLLVKAIVDKTPEQIFAIANQVLGQDISRARDEDNSERIVDKHQKLKFIAGDIIYMNIKLEKPNIVFHYNNGGVSGQKVEASALKDLYASDENYTLKITLV